MTTTTSTEKKRKQIRRLQALLAHFLNGRLMISASSGGDANDSERVTASRRLVGLTRTPSRRCVCAGACSLCEQKEARRCVSVSVTRRNTPAGGAAAHRSAAVFTECSRGPTDTCTHTRAPRGDATGGGGGGERSMTRLPSSAS